ELTAYTNQSSSQSPPLKNQFISTQTVFDPLRRLPIIHNVNVTKILLVTYFRGGSTFLGDLLQQNWNSFYHFEPLHYMTVGIRIENERTEEAFRLIKHLFKCDFINVPNYIKWVSIDVHQHLFEFNKFLQNTCYFRPASCFDSLFIEQVCLRSPIQIMKVARLSMRHIEKLAVNDLNLKVVYLVRDPRGIYSSRKLMDCQI
ncbi:unnamed protein product, partial [Didymodactylos carnosus]